MYLNNIFLFPLLTMLSWNEQRFTLDTSCFGGISEVSVFTSDQKLNKMKIGIGHSTHYSNLTIIPAESKWLIRLEENYLDGGRFFLEAKFDYSESRLTYNDQMINVNNRITPNIEKTVALGISLFISSNTYPFSIDRARYNVKNCT